MDYFNSATFAALVEELMRQHHVPGLAAAVVQGDEIASAGYGKACLEPPKTCTADTLFDIASSSKCITAAAVGLLVDDDENYPEVQHDAIMSHLLPDDFVISDRLYTEQVTVEDILSHRSGMPGHDFSYLSPRAAKPDNAKSVTRNLRNLPVAAPIRTKYLYCNMMFTVATHLVEVKSQQSFSDFLQSRLFQPLNMISTSLQPQRARDRGFGDRIATGYTWNKAESAYRGFQSLDCPEGQGAGSIITSANDLIKWVKALVNHEGPITDRVYQGLVRTRTFKNPDCKWLKKHTSPMTYAAGVDVYFYRGHQIVCHDGMVPGFGSRFFFLPEFNFGAVFMGNSIGVGSIAGILTRELIDEVLQVPAEERPNGKPGKKAARMKDREVKVSLNGMRVSVPKVESQELVEEQEGYDGWIQVPHPRDTALDGYTGRYENAGYHSLTVEIRDGGLFINAIDRSMAFTATFEHISDGTKYIAHLRNPLYDEDDPVEAEFVLKDGKAVRLGLRLEMALKEKIWFDKEASLCTRCQAPLEKEAD